MVISDHQADDALRFLHTTKYPYYLVDVTMAAIHSGWDHKADAKDALAEINSNPYVPEYSHIYRIWTRNHTIRKFIQWRMP